MSDDVSQFARMLKTHRTTRGRNGRMTQEQLAEELGVSVDAIGKYERSVSFIRGDLEHRLADRLGWSRAEILACRKDWETRQARPVRSRYRVLDDALLDTLFDGSWQAASLASIEMAEAELGQLPTGLAANRDVFLPIYETYRDHWAAIICAGQMVAKWTLPFLLPEDEALFRAGRLIEAEMSVERLRRAILPGTYFGYCPALIVRPGHEAAGVLLMSSFVSFLETLAERDVLLHGMGTISVTPGGAQICQDLGMSRLGSHVLNPDYGLWVLPGADLPGSIFGRRSKRLRHLYREAFG